MLDPEIEGSVDRLTRVNLTLANSALREQLREQRVEIATLRHALRELYANAHAAREVFSDELMGLIGYRRKDAGDR